MIKYIIRDREAGNFIDEFETLEQAEKALAEYEATDKEEGAYTPDFYEIAYKAVVYDNGFVTLCELKDNEYVDRIFATEQEAQNAIDRYHEIHKPNFI